MYKDTCYSWTELNTNNSKIGSWGRDLPGVLFKYLFSFFLGLSVTPSIHCQKNQRINKFLEGDKTRKRTKLAKLRGWSQVDLPVKWHFFGIQIRHEISVSRKYLGHAINVIFWDRLPGHLIDSMRRREGVLWIFWCWCVRCLLITESLKTPGHYRYQIWVLGYIPYMGLTVFSLRFLVFLCILRFRICENRILNA